MFKCQFWNVYNNFMFLLFFIIISYLATSNGKISIKVCINKFDITITNKLYMQDAGVYTVSRGDLGMIFCKYLKKRSIKFRFISYIFFRHFINKYRSCVISYYSEKSQML